MKRISGLFFAALLGGLCSIGIVKLMESPTQVSNGLVVDQVSTSESNFPLQSPTNVQTGLASTLPATSIDFTKAAESSVNAVVHVKTESMVESEYYSFDPFRDFFFGPSPQKKEYRPATGSGSGVIISGDGFVVTNNHVIADAEKMRVTLNDNKTYEARLIGADPTTDLALLKIDGANLPYVPYGNSDDLKIGEWVLAVGNPFNLTSTVTAGIVSAKGRDINILDNDPSGLSAIESFIQTDAAVNPGNSGGALVSTSGDLIGINTAIKSNTGSFAGYSFAIPVNIVKKVVDDLLEYGVVQRGFIGVSIRNVDDQLVEEHDLKSNNGIFVSGLTAGGAAEEAGIESGDVIRKIGNMPVNDVPQLQEQLSRFRPGNQIMVTVDREGEEEVIPVVLRNKFGNTDLMKKENTKFANALGATFSKPTAEELTKLGLTHGLKVTRMDGGKLRSSGIKEGFIITKVDKQDVSSFEEFVGILENLEDTKEGVLIEGVYPNGMGAYYGFGM